MTCFIKLVDIFSSINTKLISYISLGERKSIFSRASSELTYGSLRYIQDFRGTFEVSIWDFLHCRIFTGLLTNKQIKFIHVKQLREKVSEEVCKSSAAKTLIWLWKLVWYGKWLWIIKISKIWKWLWNFSGLKFQRLRRVVAIESLPDFLFFNFG